LTSIDVSTLSRVSKAVQRDGLIRRKRTDEDQRTVRVTLTDKGRELVQKIIPSARHIQDEIIGDLPASDVEALIRILHVVAKNLSRYTESDFDLIETGVAGEAGGTNEKPEPVKKPANGAARRAPAKRASGALSS
jgi:DNA-binding PadR family transcriptional regulator